MSARPIAAPFPSRAGTYWIRYAKAGWSWEFGLTWDNPIYEWIIGRIDGLSPNWFEIIGSDHTFCWEGADSVVVEVGPEIIPPGIRPTKAQYLDKRVEQWMSLYGSDSNAAIRDATLDAKAIEDEIPNYWSSAHD